MAKLEKDKLPKQYKHQEILFDEYLKFPISNNNLYQPSFDPELGKHITITKLAWQYYKDMKTHLDKLMVEKYKTIPINIRIHAEVYFYEKDKRHRDINNYSKTLFDALEDSKVFDNDSQIDSTYLQRMPELVKYGKVRVILRRTEGVNKQELITVKESEEQEELNNRSNERLRLIKKACGEEQKNIAKSWEVQEIKKFTGRFKRKVQ